MLNSEGTNVMVKGRLVWGSGDLFKGRLKTDQRTKQPILNEKGEQKIEYGFGLAVPKGELAFVDGNIWKALHDEAYKLYTNRQVPTDFAWKYKDGDTGVTKEGAPLNVREGYAGHIVLACTTSWPIKFYRYENGQHFQVNEGIKIGDYVEVQINVKVHPSLNQGDPGLYINPNAVRFLGYGKEIISAPSGDQIFAHAPVMPNGASATPLSPGGFIQPTGPAPVAPGYPPQPTMPAAPPQYAQPQAAPVAPPNYNVLPQIHQPQAPQPMQMPPPPQYAQQPAAYPPAPVAPGYPPQPTMPAAPPQYAQPPGLPYPPR